MLCVTESIPRNRDLALGGFCGQNSTLGLNTYGFLPVLNLHPQGSPMSCPASLQQAEAITCCVNLICSHTWLIVSTARESEVRLVQLKFGLDDVSSHTISLVPTQALAAQPAIWQSCGAGLFSTEPVVAISDSTDGPMWCMSFSLVLSHEVLCRAKLDM